MTNFDFLKAEKKFAPFADTAIAAERVLNIDVPTCVVNCRRAMEFAVKWMYSVDSSLSLPYQDKLVTLLGDEDFKDIVGMDIWRRLDYIRVLGNKANHTGKQYKREAAELALENLFVFLDFIAYCYGADYKEQQYDKSLLTETEAAPIPPIPDVDTAALMAENQALREKLTTRRTEREETYVQKPLELTEYATRKIYIDTMLQDAGWTEGVDWLNEYELKGMPNKSETGFADYVLFGNNGKPLAVVEAKKTCVDVSTGRQQAKLYADSLEREFGRRPVIFLTNGFETRILDTYPERKVSGFYSKRDLEKEFNKLTMRSGLSHVQINDNISGRYYQKEAIKKVCDAFDAGHRRKALLVMATGSGKTRTVISLVDVLLRHGWVKNVLFLADRTSLVTQAKRAFANHLPDLSITNLCEDKENLTARGVFSTYQTMMSCIDDARNESGGRLFTCGHFDLLICDEAHRSIYNKYRDIFTYFDAHLVGLTATPKDEIDRDTYGIFELEKGVPTYGYDLDQAVKDGFLVDFVSIETKLKFIEEGIAYEDLSEEEKAQYEELFTAEDGAIPERISSAALNEWIFNEDTIRQVLNILMINGIHVEFGSKIGKTILFAKNHKHAEKIYEIFGKEYPHYPTDYCRVIDNYTKYAQSLIDEFSNPQKMPQIAISVDMMDTGIDVPECVNLVFFKKVMSKAKFWQMIGRGTRLCPDLLDGKDKEQFYIFDFCGNFEFFRMNNKGKEASAQRTVQEQIFNLKFNIAYKLQAVEYQVDYLIDFRKEIVADLIEKVRELNRDNFAVKQHLKYVELYSSPEAYQALTYENTLQSADELAPLIEPYADDAAAVRFDALLYGIEYASLVGKSYSRAKSDLIKKVRAIANISTIPEILAKKAMIEQVVHTDLVERAGIEDFERIREELRDLMKYVPKGDKATYDTDFDDDILDMQWNESDLTSDELDNYKKKAAHYIRQHSDELVIAKLKTNIPLTESDIEQLEQILWSQVGSKQEYELECGDKPLGVFVREIVGLDMAAAKEAFSSYLNDANLDARQIYFVNQIIEYIVQNGMLTDFTVLQDSPFTDQGSVAEIFTDLSVWAGIRGVVETINANACVA